MSSEAANCSASCCCLLRDRHKVGELPGGSSEQAVYQMIAAEA